MRPEIISIAAAAVYDHHKGALLVRKRGTDAFMQPGGKIEQGETATQTLCRELREEISVTANPEELKSWGNFSAIAANEPNTSVHAEMFLFEYCGEVKVNAEIEEYRWVDPAMQADVNLAPLTRDYVLPLLAKLLNRAAFGMRFL